MEYEIKIMYITTQVANWLLTKRFWSHQAGDQSLMQLAVVGMTLAMVATNWQLEGPVAAKSAIRTYIKYTIYRIHK